MLYSLIVNGSGSTRRASRISRAQAASLREWFHFSRLGSSNNL